jgi:hypothetical protein
MTRRDLRTGARGVAAAAVVALAATLLGCSHGGSIATGGDAAAAGAGGTGTGDPDGERTDGAGTGGTAGGAGTGGAAACVAPPAPSSDTRVHTGDLTIADPAGLEAARALSEVTGTLRVAPALSGALDLPNLRVIGGDLIVEAVLVSPGTTFAYPSISDVRMVNLTRIGGDLWIYLATALVETDLRSLASVGGEVYVHRNTQLRGVGLDSLRDVGSSVHFSANQLARCEVDAIVAALHTGTFSGLGGDKDCACVTTCGHLVARCP